MSTNIAKPNPGCVWLVNKNHYRENKSVQSTYLLPSSPTQPSTKSRLISARSRLHCQILNIDAASVAIDCRLFLHVYNSRQMGIVARHFNRSNAPLCSSIYAGSTRREHDCMEKQAFFHKMNDEREREKKWMESGDHWVGAWCGPNTNKDYYASRAWHANSHFLELKLQMEDEHAYEICIYEHVYVYWLATGVHFAYPFISIIFIYNQHVVDAIRSNFHMHIIYICEYTFGAQRKNFKFK